MSFCFASLFSVFSLSSKVRRFVSTRTRSSIFIFFLNQTLGQCQGDPKQILHPTDSEGNLCGSGIYSDRRYLYFFDWTKCVRPFNPTSLISSRRQLCPTKQVCVHQCPNVTSFYKLDNYRYHVVCHYDVHPTEADLDRLIQLGHCSSYVIASKPLFDRCIPEQLERLIGSLVEVRRISLNISE